MLLYFFNELKFPYTCITVLPFQQALRVSMEEQRQRQDDEAKQAVDASKTEQPVTVADSATGDDDALLRSALSMSVAGVSIIMRFLM